MAEETAPERRGEYEARGDYHRHLDDAWDYRPTYLAKMRAVRRHLDRLPRDARVLDAGCGEGVLVQDTPAGCASRALTRTTDWILSAQDR